MGRLGSFIRDNKGKILLSLGAMALASALRRVKGLYSGKKARPEVEPAVEAEAEVKKTPTPPKPRPNKREIYRAPKIPPKNLIKH